MKPLARLRIPTASQAWLSLVVVILVCLGFFPTLIHDYVPQDQWRAFRYSLADEGVVARAKACTQMIPQFYLLTGRPLVWIGECLEHAWVARIHDFAALRLIVLLMVVGSVLALGRVLSPVMGSFAAGVTVAAAAAFAPGYAFMYFQGLTGGPVVLSLLFAALSFDFLMRADGGLGNRSIGWASAQAGLSLLFFLLACFIYPTFAFVWVPLALVYLGFDHNCSFELRLKRCARTVLFYGIGSMLYFVLIKAAIFLVVTITKETPPELGQYTFSIASRAGLVLEKLRELLNFFYQSTTVANFFSWPGYLKVALLLAPAFFLAGHPHTGHASSSGGYGLPVLYVVAIPLVIVLGAAPWLISNFEGITHRHTITLQFLLVFSIGVLVRELSRRVFSSSGARQATEFILLVALLVPATFQQVRLSVVEVMQSDAEIRYMRSALKRLIASGEFSQLQQFHVIRPDPGMDFVGWSRTGKGEVSQPVTSANPEHIFQMVTALLRELLPNEGLRSLNIVDCRLDAECVQASARQDVLVLSQSGSNEQPQLLDRSFVLDYRLIQARRIKAMSHSVLNAVTSRFERENDGKYVVDCEKIPIVTASSQLSKYGPEGLLLAKQPGWHSASPPKYPESIMVDFQTTRTLRRLRILPQDQHILRAPKNIWVEISDDGSFWSRVAASDNAACIPDASDEWSTVNFDRPATGRYLRIVILSNCGDPSLITFRGLRFD